LDDKGAVHRGEIFPLMSVQGQNEKPPFSGLCQLPPAATDIAPCKPGYVSSRTTCGVCYVPLRLTARRRLRRRISQ